MQARSTLTAIARIGNSALFRTWLFRFRHGDAPADNILWRNHSTGANVIWLSAN